MKILHIAASYKPAYIYGGPIQSVGKLCEAIAIQAQHQNIDLEVFTTTANGETELDVEINKKIEVDGVRVTYFKRWTKDHSHFSPGLLLSLRKVLRQTQQGNEKIVVHIHAWWNLVSVLSCLIAKWYKVPVVLSPRGMLTSYSQNNRHSFFKTLIHKIIGRTLLQYCHIHATSEQEVTDIEFILKPKSIDVIHNLVQISEKLLSKDSSVAMDQPKPFRLIFLSRIEEKKGLTLLFDALAILGIPWTLTIAGSGEKKYLDSLKQKTEELKVNSRIKWIGQVSNEDKFEILMQHDLLVLTSYNENFANVVIESLSLGTPVLISDQVGLSGYVLEKKLGWVTALNPTAIQKSLLQANQDQEKRNLIHREAPMLIAKDFKDSNLVQKYLNLYQNITH
ncbi:XrtY-associated glycosyltransferase XYAG1 [Pedobacter sp. CFBP9032]|uniref:XrtY-associated glycosyltransferase XYAG1 n=1 Tax=Pedobacter sp. CFBP9032 TaxID=3096539 RepID=UPI002A6B0057|nr:glycosyltransferase [Pedobacter sp. CFBP9032]MDY0907460.1 glycosyltransferase [Pedobacter sp. CFBP9032]